ncbi:MAG: serine/threonine-protein kinase [Thermogemmata sp.]|nr:serine/threonine-protein kinase [Thermogemmata fonticola]MCX8139346.1 serine/threonine protein kinase [Gemmataceae bacterium]
MGWLDFLFGGKKNPTASSGGTARKKLKPVNLEKRFDLSGRTGQGSMSKVYRAYDRELGRIVCLKVLDKVKTANFEARFKGLNKPSEGEICLSLRHDNIVRTYEHGISTQGDPFLVMEWIEGLGLNYLIETRSKQLNGNRINYLCQLCDAVQYLHDNRWLHRDLCPRNVMIDNEGVLKLIDFGLTIPWKPEFCSGGNRTGTPDILAPEIIRRRPIDNRVDLFALGVTAYEIFLNQLPWERSLSSEETFRRRMNLPPRHPKELKPDIEDDLAAVLFKSVAKEPQDRFSSATAFKEALLGLERQDY